MFVIELVNGNFREIERVFFLRMVSKAVMH